MSEPRYSIGFKNLPGGKVYLDRSGLPSCCEDHPPHQHVTCSICGNAVIIGTVEAGNLICSACETSEAGGA